MKKALIGIGVVLVVLGVGASVAVYLAASRARAYLQERGVLASLQGISKGVSNQSPFAPPATGELTPELIRRFAAVQEAMRAKMGARFQEIAAMQDDMLRRQAAEHRKSTPGEDVQNVGAMMGFVVQAQAAWMDALNEQRFSLDEYEWVRARVYAAAGSHLVQMNTRQLSAALKGSGAPVHAAAMAGDAVPQRNTELVAPYLPKMKDWAVMAFFGL